MVTAIVHTEDTSTLTDIPAENITRKSNQSDYYLVDFNPIVRAEEHYGGEVSVEFENGDEYKLENTDLVGVFV